MEVLLEVSGSNSAVREKLNELVHAPAEPRSPGEDQAVRAIAHYIASEILDPPYSAWQEQVNDIAGLRLKGSKVEIPVEPRLSLSVSVSIVSAS